MKLLRMSSSRHWRRGMVGLLVSAVLAATGSLVAAPKPSAKKSAKPTAGKARPATTPRVAPKTKPDPAKPGAPTAPPAPILPPTAPLDPTARPASPAPADAPVHPAGAPSTPVGAPTSSVGAPPLPVGPPLKFEGAPVNQIAPAPVTVPATPAGETPPAPGTPGQADSLSSTPEILPDLPPLPPAPGAPLAGAPSPAKPPGAPPGTAGKPVVDDLYEGPAKPKPSVPVKPVKPDGPNDISAPIGPGPKFADAWPSEFRVAESDLALQATGEARAQAITEFLRGKLAQERGDDDVALEAWKKAASLDPSDAKLAVDVATELAKRNETAEAIRVLKDSIAAAPTEPKALLYLAQIYAKHLNKTDVAVQTAQKAIEVAPEYFPAYETLFELVAEQTDKKKAGEVMDRALKSPAKTPQFWLRLGDFLAKTSFDKADKVSPEDLARVERAYLRAVELKPDDASVLAQTGDLYARAKDPKRALDFYARAIKLNQAPTDDATKGLRENYIEALIENDRHAEALPLLEELMRDPSAAMDHRLYVRLGEVYEQTKQPEKAIDLFKRSLVFDTSDPTYHLSLAFTLLRAKRFDEAVETAATAVKKFPDRPGVQWEYARVLGAAKRHDDALAIYTKTYDAAKGADENILTPEFYFQWGATAERAGKLDLAAEKLKVAIENNPRSSEYLNYLGYMWVEKGIHLEEAAELIRRALEIKPRDGMYLDSLGWYYYKVGKYEEAKRELLSALDLLKEEDAAILDHVADTYEKLGNLREAIAFWERALKRKPDEPEKIQEKIDAAKKKTLD